MREEFNLERMFKGMLESMPPERRAAFLKDFRRLSGYHDTAMERLAAFVEEEKTREKED
jgi:hypothetical protein